MLRLALVRVLKWLSLPLHRHRILSYATSIKIQASSELLKHLTTAAASLAQFQQLAFPVPSPVPLSISGILQPISFPSPAPSPPSNNPSSSAFPGSEKEYHKSFRDIASSSPSLGSDCCGGIMDCTNLVDSEEEVEEIPTMRESDSPAERLFYNAATSGLRFTSNNLDK